MSIQNMKIIHVRTLYKAVGLTLDRGRRVLRDLERKGEIEPEVTETGREYISPNEAERLHKAVHA